MDDFGEVGWRLSK